MDRTEMDRLKDEQQSLSSVNFWPFTLVGMLLVVTTTGFARMAYGLILPYMEEDLGFSVSQGGMLGTIMFLGYLVTVGLSGLLAIRWGGKSVLLMGGSAVIVSMFGLSWASSMESIAPFMLLAGAGSSLVFTPLMTIMLGFFPNRKGTVLGLLLSGAGIGMLLSGFLVPFLIGQFPDWRWRAVWLCFGFLSLIVVLAALVILRNPAASSSRKSIEDRPAWLKNKGLMRVASLYFLIGLAYLIPNLYQTGFMLDQGLSDQTAGVTYAVAGIFSIVGGPVWGSMSDRFGVNRMFVLSWSCAVAGDLIPMFTPSVTGFIISSMLWGSSIGGLITLIQIKAAQQVPQSIVAAALGFISVFYAVGQMLGPGLSGWIIHLSGNYTAAYGFGAIVYAAGLGITLYASKAARSLQR
ncbi:MFS transporter [Paenibacillus radicis (ex Xue et al. 2023)]|uniref:MFS transporter n=1 Tax=Paenibacillus radicis (ex Xue et al. 2023) TaxID=2972489 RepID=A0ABT1YDF4_9BACL|nr:MFS transporter [Paenibacillus radicis (ex Xue et al. 2023)]MCR8630957.1 MFS transporter [Paenibacillus radicis (ex Xue et al. 2023)]